VLNYHPKAAIASRNFQKIDPGKLLAAAREQLSWSEGGLGSFDHRVPFGILHVKGLLISYLLSLL
jgi:hypothetical protein